VIGTFVVVKRLVFISGGISQGPIIDPAGTSLTHGNSYTIDGYEAAVNATAAALNFTPTCLENTFGALVRDEANGHLKRNTGVLTFTAGECNRCCGSGELSVYFNNGGGSSTSKTYTVRRTYGTGQIGKAFRCVASGTLWAAQSAPYDCDGTIGTFADLAIFSTLNDCVAAIDDSTDYLITYYGGCYYSYCCYFSKNDSTGTDFRSYVVSVSGPTCCNIITTNGSWIQNNGNCCPK
jgi:hypothetical protein